MGFRNKNPVFRQWAKSDYITLSEIITIRASEWNQPMKMAKAKGMEVMLKKKVGVVIYNHHLKHALNNIKELELIF